ncbi:MAG: wax ester/triacylglycerol synthase family O-acyltransferase [Myxococcota bacterium]
MARYERLSVIDRTFLDLESSSHPQHIAATLIFEAGPLRTREGGVDAERIRRYIASRLYRIPRYRQKLAWIPVEGHPVWVDDDTFSVHYHVRHTSLPAPGGERQLKRLAGRIMSQQLDRGKPLWEAWIVEGLTGDRFALITKTHHCMIDGIAGVDLMTVLLSASAEEAPEEAPRWLPEPSPSRLALARLEATRRLLFPLHGVRGLARAARDPLRSLGEAREQLAALGETLSAGLYAASETPLNQELGPHRRFDWTSFDLAQVKAVKNKLGGTVNDVVIAIVAGALGRFLEHRGITQSAQSQLEMRAMVPVSIRPSSDRGAAGNQIALWAVHLPVAERNPHHRLSAVREVTARLKESKQALGASVLAAVSEWTVPTLLSLATRMAYRFRASNLVVTNVPGPQLPLYLLGARMGESYPMLNLLMNHSLGVALFSYHGRLHWGFMADWDLVPDLHDFVDAIHESFDELCRAAGVEAGSEVEARDEPPHVRALS